MDSMIGTKVGRWTVLREVRKNGRKYYECRCDCGTVKEVYYRSLTEGKSLSCGCLRAEERSAEAMDLTGMRFGKLLVLRRDPGRKDGGNYFWICECDCGNRKSIRGTSLVMKNGTRSCGCDQRAVASQTGRKTVAENARRQIERNMAYGTNFQVIENSSLPKNNKSGHKGVCWDKRRELWEANIQVQGKKKFLGRYSKYEDAVKARELAEELYFEPLIEQKRSNDGEVK